MIELTPDTIRAIGGVIVALLGAWQARTASKVSSLETSVIDLKARLKAVEAERDQIRQLLRIAVQHIREWMAWATNHAPGTPAPPLPMELRDEV